jgi:superfamily II DNA or RNA helicase
LVICPAILGPQWVEELASKFGIPAIFAKGQELINAMERSVVPVVVTTYQTASSRIANFRPDHFDMLILDEAHKLRNLHGTPNPPQMAHRVRCALETRVFKYVLMLTATPIQNRVWDLYSLIDLLTVAKGHRNPLGTPAEFRARYISDTAGRKLNPYTAEGFRAILRQYVVRTRREEARLKFPDT